jgi:tetratricopeptide (TPR) repeat protein
MRYPGLNISLLILSFLIHFPAFSQLYPLDLKTADSLEKISPTAQGMERVDILNGMSYALLRHYSSRSDSLATLSLALAREMDYTEGKAKALYCKGTNVYINGDFITALDMLYEAADLFEGLKDTAMLIDSYLQIGAITFFSLTDVMESIRLVEKCVDLARESGNILREAQMYSCLQYVWAFAGGEEKRREFLQKYQAIAIDLPISIVEKLYVTGTFGTYDFFEGNYREALSYYFRSLRLADLDNVEERAYVTTVYLSAGDAYLGLNIPDSALYYYQYGRELSRKYKHYYGSMSSSFKIANFYFKKDPYRQVLVYCDSVVYYGRLIESGGSFFGVREYNKLIGMGGELYFPLTRSYKKYMAWSFMAQAYKLMRSTYQSLGEYKEALEAYDSYTIINDSITGFQKRKELLELQYKYQAEQKDQEITLLSQQNQLQSLKLSQNRLILFSVIAVIILVMMIFLMMIRQNRIRSREQVTEFKQKLLRSQMNPHFIFNSLTSIQNFIIKQDDIRASVYLSRFSELVRSILNHSMVEKITLGEELKTVENYLELQKVRFADKFDYTIDIDPDIDIESVMIPPMLAQPFIENAIEHGIKRKEGKGHIAIRIGRLDDWAIGRLDDWTIFEIEDDGIGREKARDLLLKQEENHKSLATVITRERIAALNRKSKKKITLEIIDLKDETGEARGTLVRFGIPMPLASYISNDCALCRKFDPIRGRTSSSQPFLL